MKRRDFIKTTAATGAVGAVEEENLEAKAIAIAKALEDPAEQKKLAGTLADAVRDQLEFNTNPRYRPLNFCIPKDQRTPTNDE